MTVLVDWQGGPRSNCKFNGKELIIMFTFPCALSLFMSSLNQQFKELLTQYGQPSSQRRAETLKKCLQKKFGDIMSFWHPRNTS